MISGATPVINANAEAPQPNLERKSPRNRCGAKKDAANGPKSARRLVLINVPTVHQEWPRNRSVDVFFTGSTCGGRFAVFAWMAGLLFLRFFSINIGWFGYPALVCWQIISLGSPFSFPSAPVRRPGKVPTKGFVRWVRARVRRREYREEKHW